MSRAIPGGRPRASSWSASADAEPVEHEPERVELLDGGSIGRASASRSGARRGRNGSISSPRARAWSRAPSSPNRATSAERGSSATAPILPQPEPREPGPDVRVRGEERAGCGARKAASSPGGTRTGSPSSPASAAATVAANRVPAIPARGIPGSTPASAAPSPGPSPPPRPTGAQAVDLDLEQAERGVGRPRPPRSPG